jgi:hypothetical protein
MQLHEHIVRLEKHASWFIDLTHTDMVAAFTSSYKEDLFLRFENLWAEHQGFLDTVSSCWSSTLQLDSYAKTLSAKFKNLRTALNKWSRGLFNLSPLITNCNIVISFLDALEDSRYPINAENNLRRLVKTQLAKLLRYKNLY